MECCWNIVDRMRRLDEESRIKKHKSRQIDIELKKDKDSSKRLTNILLLGASESGKSTIVKQMRIIHGSGYSEIDRRGYKANINKNLCTSMITLIDHMDKFQCTFENEDNEVYAEDLKEMDLSNRDTFRELTSEIFDAIESLWKDGGIQDVYKRRNLFYLTDSAEYYFSKIGRIRKEKYIPSVDDILRMRIETTGILEQQFDFHGYTINMVDVGGQTTERRKWIHCFEKVSSIIFLAALSGYDEIPRNEADSTHENQMRLATDLFKQVLSYEIFSKTSVILFLNKIDIFEKKIKTSNIVDYFNSYDGQINDATEGKQFLLNIFKDIFFKAHSIDEDEEKSFFSHFTCATDTENIKVVFAATRDIILRGNLTEVAIN